MDPRFISLHIPLLLLHLSPLNAAEGAESILYGVCCQFNNPNSNSAQVVISTDNLNIDFETNYGFELSNGPINCIWLNSSPNIQSVSEINTEHIRASFNKNNANIQEYTQDHPSEIECNHHKIHIHQSNIPSKHLCSDTCQIEDNQPCFSSLQPRSMPSSLYGHSDVSPLIPSMFGISGICIAFIVVCIIVYCFGVRYSRWSEQKSGNETEQVIGDVLEEIAKFTIGDEEDEGLYEDWNIDSDQTQSSDSSEAALGRTILRVVSNNIIDDINPSIYSESESESDEEQCRQDLLVAKETLFSLSHGTNNPYSSNLQTINERFLERNASVNSHSNVSLSNIRSGEYGVLSDVSNSALP